MGYGGAMITDETAHGPDVLVLGGTGTTGRRVAHGLAREGRSVRAVSRSTAVRFDWSDAATHGPALAGVRAVYLLPPVGVPEPEPVVAPFVERALAGGVRRFVLLSASVIAEGDAGVGQLHALLRRIAPEWAVLRPSWFMQNLESGSHTAADVRDLGELATSVGDGRIAFVDADDIAAVAVRALLDEQPHQGEHVITGPAALSYDDVAAVLTRVSGRRVVHRRVTRDVVRRRMERAGIPADYAEVLSAMEGPLSAGIEDRTTDAVQRVTGRPPRSLQAWAEAHAAAWR